MDINTLREVTQGGAMVTPFVTVSRRATMDNQTTVEDFAEVHGEVDLKNSIVRGFAKVFNNVSGIGSVFQEYSHVGGIVHFERSVAGGTADVRDEAVVSHSVVTDNAHVFDKASLLECHIGGNARVGGSADLYRVNTGRADKNTWYYIVGDVELNFPVAMDLRPGTRVEAGSWQRPPFVIDLEPFIMCEAYNDKVSIGCLTHTLKFWYEHGRSVLLKYGLPESMYPRYEEAMREMEQVKREFGSPRVRRRAEKK